MLKIVPFELDHYDRMGDLREPMAPGLFGVDYRVILESYRKRGVAWTLLDEEDVIFCGGVVILWPGVGEAWTVMSKKVQEYPLAVAKALLAGIDKAGLRRVHASVRWDDQKARKLIELCGFLPEGVMTAYGPEGEDHVLYARIRG